MKDYSKHIQKSSQKVEIKAMHTHTKEINGHNITFHVADINDYRTILWRSENISFATCDCQGHYFNETCKHEYALIKKVEESQPKTPPPNKQHRIKNNEI